MVIDQKISVIGTFNLDPRSANLNTECIVVVYDDKISQDLFNTMAIELEPANSWQTTLTFNPDSEAGWSKNFQVWLAGIIPKSVL